MSNLYPSAPGSGGGDGGPPGQNLLGITLAALAAIFGTPILFQWIGPVFERLVYEVYGSRDLAELMYYASFALSGIVIYAACRIALWYAIAAIVAFLSMRFSGFALV